MVLNKLSVIQILIMVFLSQIPYHAFAQKDFIRGAIITNNYDTISGFILAKPKYTNKDQVVFSKWPSGQHPETYYPDQLIKFILDNKEYLSLPVSYYEEEGLNFIHRIFYGYYLLYEGHTSDGQDFYCLQTEKYWVIRLPEESIEEWVQKYFSDCEFKHPRMFYDEVSISNLLSKYSQCKQPEKFVYEKSSYKQRLCFGLKMGTNVAFMKFVNEKNPYYGKSFNPYLGYQGGVTFNFDLSRYLQVEIDLFISKLQGELIGPVTFNFERIDINVPFLIRYVVKRNFVLEPYINLGLDLRTMVKYSFRLIDNNGVQKLEPTKGAAGLLAGIGTFIPVGKKIKVTIDFQYSYFQHISYIKQKSDYALKNQVIILSTGILF